MAFLVTCEHGAHQIPGWLADHFVDSDASASDQDDASQLADSYDLGAMDAASQFARQLNCPFISAKYSPRVVDVNRAANHRGVFSPVTRELPRELRSRIISEIHQPFRKDVETAVDRSIRKDGLVIHLSIHSFATFEPTQTTLEGEDRALSARRTDLGLLYDPSRAFELALCLDWFDDLYYALPMLRVRRNYPRRGVSESLIRTFRQKYAPDSYIGVELQLNRAWCVRDVPVRKKVFKGIAKSLIQVCSAAQDDRDQEAA
jgi:predicted N-formylglutamate amidohydrolase